MLQNNIPAELRALPQWAYCTVTNRDDPDHKRPRNPKTGYWASPTDPSSWGTFEQAMQHGLPVGFMLHIDDPYVIIDLDNKDYAPVPQHTLDGYMRLVEAADTYAEKSISGRGIHIIMKGSVPAGCKRESSEIYSQERFMICTGDVISNKPIAERQELATWFWKELGGDKIETYTAGPYIDPDPTLTDQSIMEMAWEAENSHKFQKLWFGEWEELGYPSQSEADFALLSMLAFYSQSNVQVVRLFRQSGLGKREKATKNLRYLVGECLDKIRAHQPPPVEIPSLESLRAALTPPPAKAAGPMAFSIPFNFIADATNLLVDADAAPKAPKRIAGLPKCPGLIGELADYIYSSAHRPAAELALGAAMGLLAGVAGRAYNISGSGLNQYIVVIAPTGSGKEAIGTGIDRLISAARKFSPQADVFQGPSGMASGQALMRVLPDKPCFVSVLGEFGMLLHGMSKAKPGDAQHTFKRVLLDVYAKSGISSWLKPVVYSDKEKNTALVQAPNVTFVGESTPEEFYKALDISSVADGFVPRLLLIEYKGGRPSLNDNAGFDPPEPLVRKLAEVINIAISVGQRAEGAICCNIRQTPDAAKILRDFNDEIDAKFDMLKEGPQRQILNRAHFKAIKLAGLLAVGVNWNDPEVNTELAKWAVQFVRNDMTTMMARFDSGMVGEGDDASAPERTIRDAIYKLFDMTGNDSEVRQWKDSYKVPRNLDGTTIITHNFINQFCRNRQPFKADKRGATRALNETILDLVNSGVLVDVPKAQAIHFGLRGKAYIPGEAF